MDSNFSKTQVVEKILFAFMEKELMPHIDSVYHHNLTGYSSVIPLAD
jgi:hypothetical protein